MQLASYLLQAYEINYIFYLINAHKFCACLILSFYEFERVHALKLAGGDKPPSLLIGLT